MPVENPRGRNWWRIITLACCIALQCALIWLNFQGGGIRHGALLTAVSFGLLLVLAWTGIIPVPQDLNLPFFGTWPRLSDSIKAAVALSLIFVWTPIAIRLTPDTPVGVAVILIPDAVFALSALVYLSNSISRTGK